MRTLFYAVLLLLSGAKLYAAPLGYEDSTMTMVDINPNWRQAFVNYAPTPQDALGFGAVWMRNADHSHSMTGTTLEYTRLIKRWNLNDAQANIFGIVGAGNMQDSMGHHNRALLTYGAQADYETTRLYAALKTRWYQTSHAKMGFSSLTLGAAFYEVEESTDIQPWLVLEAQRMNGLRQEWEFTPMLRLIHQRFYIEAGITQHRDFRLSSMFIF